MVADDDAAATAAEQRGHNKVPKPHPLGASPKAAPAPPDSWQGWAERQAEIDAGNQRYQELFEQNTVSYTHLRAHETSAHL
eukprot:827534-Alexandrium_andersonii.AAC.1